MKPTLEEVKAYFKNAKEVICLFDEKVYDISEWKFYFDNKDNSYWVENGIKTDIKQCELWDFKYAEIISYKEPQFEYLEEVEVSHNGVDWKRVYFACQRPSEYEGDFKYICFSKNDYSLYIENNIRKLNHERAQAIEAIKELMSKHEIKTTEL